MNQDEANDAVEEIGRLFPQADLQEAELALIRDRIGKFDYGDFIEIIHAHRLGNDYNRPKIAQIMARAEARYADVNGRPNTGANADTHADIIRQQWVEKGDSRAAGMHAAEVYLRYHCRIARQAMIERREESGRLVSRTLSTSYTAKITRECARDLSLSGMNANHAKACALNVVDPSLTREGFGFLIDDVKGAR